MREFDQHSGAGSDDGARGSGCSGGRDGSGVGRGVGMGGARDGGGSTGGVIKDEPATKSGEVGAGGSSVGTGGNGSIAGGQEGAGAAAQALVGASASAHQLPPAAWPAAEPPVGMVYGEAPPFAEWAYWASRPRGMAFPPGAGMSAHGQWYMPPPAAAMPAVPPSETSRGDAVAAVKVQGQRETSGSRDEGGRHEGREAAAGGGGGDDDTLASDEGGAMGPEKAQFRVAPAHAGYGAEWYGGGYPPGSAEGFVPDGYGRMVGMPPYFPYVFMPPMQSVGGPYMAAHNTPGGGDAFEQGWGANMRPPAERQVYHTAAGGAAWPPVDPMPLVPPHEGYVPMMAPGLPMDRRMAAQPQLPTPGMFRVAGRSQFTQAEVAAHKATTHGGDALPGGEAEEVVCTIKGCGKSFLRRCRLKAHMRTHTNERPYVCQYPGCGKSFAQSGGLTVHTRMHTGERPFKCPQCDLAFAHSSHVTRHQYSHTQDRPLKCEFPGCNKGFSRPSHLRLHMRTHTGDKPFRCASEGCNKAYAQLSHLKHHLRSHFGGVRDPDSHPKFQEAMEAAAAAAAAMRAQQPRLVVARTSHAAVREKARRLRYLAQRQEEEEQHEQPEHLEKDGGAAGLSPTTQGKSPEEDTVSAQSSEPSDAEEC